MKIKFKTQVLIGPGEVLPAGSIVDIDNEDDAKALIDSGKAELPFEDNGKDAGQAADKSAAIASAEAAFADAEATLAQSTQAAEEAFAKAAAETDSKVKKILDAEAVKAKAAADAAQEAFEQAKAALASLQA